MRGAITLLKQVYLTYVSKILAMGRNANHDVAAYVRSVMLVLLPEVSTLSCLRQSYDQDNIVGDRPLLVCMGCHRQGRLTQSYFVNV